MAAIGKRCVFCEVNPGSSREHAWPDWLLKWWRELAAQQGVAPESEFTLTGPDNAVLRNFKGALTVGGFCRDCNEGWMSAVEADVKPLLVELMIGTTRDLVKREQRLLARWATLKSLVFMLSTPDLRASRAWYRGLFRNTLPARSVSLVVCDSFHPGGSCRMRTFSSPPNSFQAVFRMGYAVLHVLGHPVEVPVDDVVRQAFGRRIVVVWPPSAKVSFPPATPTTALEVEQLAQLEVLPPEPPAQPQSGDHETA